MYHILRTLGLKLLFISLHFTSLPLVLKILAKNKSRIKESSYPHTQLFMYSPHIHEFIDFFQTLNVKRMTKNRSEYKYIFNIWSFWKRYILIFFFKLQNESPKKIHSAVKFDIKMIHYPETVLKF